MKVMSKFNARLGRSRYGGDTKTCATCGSDRPHGELNYEARTHHNARRLECIDRKACERRKRRKRK